MTDFAATPVLEGRHVRLEPLTHDHAAGLLAAADADEVFAWLSVPRPIDLAGAHAMVEAYLARPGLVPWAQIDLASGRVAGVTTYYDISVEQRTVAIGWTWLGSAFWRTGVNTEAKLLLLERAFETLGCVRVVWHTDALNDRSRAAISRLGARLEGTMRKHKRRRDGSWRDTVMFSIIDEEWPEVSNTLRAKLDP